jgi:hypothetical protein
VFSIDSGSLPPGLTLSDTSTGAITGTPTHLGTYNFTASVSDSLSDGGDPPPQEGRASQATRRGRLAKSGPHTASDSNSFSITISPAGITITGPNSNGQVGLAYTSSLGATGGETPYLFSITGGSLPPGLSLSNTTTGAITGTPTAYGTFSFTASVSDSTTTGAAFGGTESQAARRRTPAQRGAATAGTSNTFSITIAPATLTLSGPSATGQIGVVYTSSLGAAGGRTPYVFSITTGSLPPGLTLSNTATGAITGTPTTSGTFVFTASVHDTALLPTSAEMQMAARRRIAAQTGPVSTSNTYSITISPAALTLTGPKTTAQVGVAYTSAFGGAGGRTPYQFSIGPGSLPTGLSLNSATGGITGTPTTPGTFNFTATLIDTPAPTVGAERESTSARRRPAAQNGTPTASTSNAFSITVAPAAPSPTPAPPSVWMALTGLAGAGLFHLRQRRRTV